jgi:hypothetical protein
MHRSVWQYIIHTVYLLHVLMEVYCKGVILKNITKFFNQSKNIKRQMLKKKKTI